MEPKNVIRSKRLIKSAVVELMLKKNPADIKVTEITSLAEVNRGTFYAHYNTIFDVIAELEDEIIDNFLHTLNASTGDDSKSELDEFHFINFDFIEKMLKKGYEHQDLILKHYKRNLLPNLMPKFKDRIYEFILKNSIINTSKQLELDYRIIISYMVSGYVGLITDWATGNLGENVTPDIIFPYIKKMILKLSETQPETR